MNTPTRPWHSTVAILAALALMLSLITTSARADDSEPETLWINGVQAATSNYSNILGNGTARFDPATTTLYLTNAEVTTPVVLTPEPGTVEVAGIYSTYKNLTVYLTGKNTVTINESSHGINAAYFRGHHSGTITFSGTGVLEVTTSDTQQWNSAIHALPSIVVDGPTLVLRAGKSTNFWSAGLSSSYAITINSGTVISHTKDAAAGSRAIYAQEHELTINGGTVNASSSSPTDSYALTGIFIHINGGDITATAGTTSVHTGELRVANTMHTQVNHTPTASGAQTWTGQPPLHEAQPAYKYLRISQSPVAPTPTPTVTPTVTPPLTPTVTPTPTVVPTPSSTLHPTPTPTPAPSTTHSSSATPVPTASVEPSSASSSTTPPPPAPTFPTRALSAILATLGVVAIALLGAIGAYLTGLIPAQLMA
ncbi:MAG: hypothetical protein Q4A31_10665 [Corynebacterium sp.]|uniref:hypothetical protein n=1 Tax=Corynebacterium sp. TaxID=1720 RepID=UPI0026DCF6BD|nr:hypothetical protein [Corynebacterium sp.]MDO4762370.1 hypothetical protein [Corynebacterium sp.]